MWSGDAQEMPRKQSEVRDRSSPGAPGLRKGQTLAKNDIEEREVGAELE